MNIKKQTVRMYLYEAALAFRMVDAVWVIFLLERGFSLAQVGVAEGIFHITSMIFEVPSGMAADLFGRKRTLVLSGIGWVERICLLRNDLFGTQPESGIRNRGSSGLRQPSGSRRRKAV